MRKNSQIIMYITLITSLMSSFTLSLPSGSAAPSTFSLVSGDAYVDEYNPTKNYGNDPWLFVGKSFGTNRYEIFLQFDVTDMPNLYDKALVSFKVSAAFNPIYVSYSVVSGDWNEYSINWNNRPTDRRNIGGFYIGESKIYTIDITDLILEDTDTISICFEMDAPNSVSALDKINIKSKEGAFNSEEKPRIEWTQPESPTSSPIIFILPIVIVLAILIFIVSARKTSPKASIQLPMKFDAPKPFIQSEPQVSPEIKKQEKNKTPLLCKECGSIQQSEEEIFCERCGNQF